MQMSAEAPREPIVRARMPELDSLRGVAILLVLFYHGYFWRFGQAGLSGLARLFVEATWPGWLGVNLFFVLSGFLITGILLGSKLKRDYYRHFYTRRALRILPAYYAILLLLLVTGLKPRSFLVLSVFYLSNITPIFGVSQAYPVLWSLAVEEQFYLLWPTAVKRLSTKVLERCALATVAIVPVLRAISFILGWQNGFRMYTWFVIDGLAMGAWLAIYVRKLDSSRKGLARISVTALAIAVLAITAGARFGILTRLRLLGATFQETCGNLAFLGLLGLVLLTGTSRWKSLVRWSVLEFYGDISYGLYLVHLLVFGECSRLISALLPGLGSPAGSFRIMTFYFVISVTFATAVAFVSTQVFRRTILANKGSAGSSGF